MRTTTIGTTVTVLLLAATLTACPPEAPLPDDTALLVLNNMRREGNCYETQDPDAWRGFSTLCSYEVFSVRAKGPNDIGFGAERLRDGELVAPGESRSFVLDLTGNASGDWEFRLLAATFQLDGLTELADKVILYEVEPGDVYTWNWGAPQ